MKKVLMTALSAGVILVMISCKGDKMSDNPFFKPYGTPFDVPPFDKIKVEHFEPAILEGIAQHNAEIEKIVKNTEEPTFENTIAAMEYSGDLLNRVSIVFNNQTSVNTDSAIQALDKKLSPEFSKHRDDINLNAELFKRVKAVYDKRNELNINPEQLKLVEDYYKDFVRGGANLPLEKQEMLRNINQELGLASLEFGNNVLAETNSFKLVIDKKEDLAGLPESSIAMAAAEAKANNLEGKWLFKVQKPSMIPFITYAVNRDLREKLYRGYFMKGNNNNEYDNNNVISKIVELRQKRAQLLGYPTYSNYALERNMAKVPENVYALLNKLWTPALKRAKTEVADMQSMINSEGGKFKLAPWDWWYYAEKVRKEKYALDEEMLRPYFSLEGVKKGVFNLTEKLYGLKYIERNDIPKYHPDAQVYEVQEADGKHLGIIYLDFFPRESKEGGAWCTGYRSQKVMPDGTFITPIVSVVCNFTKPSGDKPALLDFDETQTFFHEFGHALNGLFSNITYPGSRRTPRDFVELPSQIMEHWASAPEYLKQYALHYQTGAPIPDELIKKIEASSVFNQGFATVELLAASILDMDYHTLDSIKAKNVDVQAFEKASMQRIGLIPEILPRYRSTYFNHTFSGGYSSGYYAYTWAEVLDADAYEAFKESGDIFNKEIATKFRKCILEKTGTKDAMEAYKDFRGQEPKIEALLRNRGLVE